MINVAGVAAHVRAMVVLARKAVKVVAVAATAVVADVVASVATIRTMLIAETMHPLTTSSLCLTLLSMDLRMAEVLAVVRTLDTRLPPTLIL
jgi:hypothetical protein